MYTFTRLPVNQSQTTHKHDMKTSFFAPVTLILIIRSCYTNIT